MVEYPAGVGETTLAQAGSGPWLVQQRYRLLSLVTVIVVLGTRFLLTNTGVISTKVLPSPQDILAEVQSLVSKGYTGKSIFLHFRASLLRVLIGLSAALVVGICIGLVMGYSRTVAAILTPVVSFVRPMPAISFVPLVVLYFGIGELSKVMVIFFTSTLYMILSASAGVKSVPEELIRAALNLGVTRRQLFLHVILPASAPHVMTGVKMATAVSWALVVAAELVAAQEGLGYIVMDAATFFRLPDVYIAISLIGLVGLCLEVAETTIENRLLHWRAK